MSDTMTCKGCYGESLPGEHLFDCPTRIRGLEDRIRELEARIAAKDEALKRIGNGAPWYKDIALEALKE